MRQQEDDLKCSEFYSDKKGQVYSMIVAVWAASLTNIRYAAMEPGTVR